MRKIVCWLAPLFVLASCTGMPPLGGVGETDVTLYRGLRVDSVGKIDWSKTSFGVSGTPATLSFFNSMASAMPCWLTITVVAPDVVTPGVHASLTIPTPPPGGANAGPWDTHFDNTPAGHWSIAKDTIGGATNGQSSIFAAAVFTAMATDGTAKVVDGTRDDCHAPG